MKDDPVAMQGLTDQAARFVADLDRVLDVSPYLVGAPAGTRARFWATLLSMVQAKYQRELQRLAAREGRGNR